MLGRAALWGIVGTGAALAAAPAQAQRAIESAAGGNSQLGQTASYVANVCPVLRAAQGSLDAGGTALFRHCAAAIRAANAVGGGDPSGVRKALDQITPQEVISQDAVISGAVVSQTSAVSARLSAMGRYAVGPGGLAMRSRPIRFAMNRAGDDVKSDVVPADGALTSGGGRLQSFVTFTYSGGDQDPTTLESGYDMDLASVTAGADYRFSDVITAGLAGGYGRTKLDFANAGGRLRTRVFTVSGYALIQPSERIDLTLLTAYSRVRYSSVRQLAYVADTDVVSGAARGVTHGDQFEVSAGGIYNLGSGEWTYGPAAQASFTRLTIDRFNESGTGSAFGLEYAFPNQTARSLQFALGFDVSRALSTEAGVISPYFRARAIVEALDRQRNIPMKYVNDRVSSFGQTMTTSPTDRDRFTLGGGVAAQLSNGMSAFVDGQALLGLRDVSQYTVSVGVRLDL